tara:strand:- start:52 stop:201 length:150 start_codon:yes stop_codon:yes gene_type:complete
MKNIDNFDLDDYINWDEIVDDFELNTGDLSPKDFYKLHEIFKRYITTNK